MSRPVYPSAEAWRVAEAWLQHDDAPIEYTTQLRSVADYVGYLALKAENEIKGVQLIKIASKRRGHDISQEAARTYYRQHREEIDTHGEKAIRW